MGTFTSKPILLLSTSASSATAVPEAVTRRDLRPYRPAFQLRRCGGGSSQLTTFGIGNSGLPSLPRPALNEWNARVFVGDETLVDVGFAVACERLAKLAESGTLISTSRDAYSHGTARVARVRAAGLSKLVRIQIRELSGTTECAGLAMRWEATGPGGGLFPLLDADIRLAPAGRHATMLMLAGVYRAPLGSLGEALDRAVLHRVAAATIRSFVSRVAAEISHQPDTAETATPNAAGPSLPPSAAGSA
jgi:hypothetical protein